MLNLSYSTICKIPVDYEANKNSTVFSRIKESNNSFDYLFDNNYDRWILTFSGGKDSSLAVILAIEYLLNHKDRIKRIDIIYSDTLLEIPSINDYAVSFLQFLKNNERLSKLPLYCHIVKPRLEDRFWVNVLGKGYPPPHQRFRWCTNRLKIRPCEYGLKKHIIKDKTAIITGVRFGESNSRDQRLNTSCVRGGECGQGIWFEKSNRLGVGYLAPLINWSSCDVWDYLYGFAPSLGYPTKRLKKIYNGHDTRFGCWMCTVVKQDKAMLRTIEQEEWSYLLPLKDCRNYFWNYTRNIDTRVLREDGTVSKIKLEHRKYLLKYLLNIQTVVGEELISEEEIQLIKKIWKNK